jgi:hypothetical protein
MYRVSYGEDASLSYDEARANLDNKFNAIFPGPKPVKYDLRMSHLTNCINVGQTSSAWDEFFSLETRHMHAIRSVGWD